MNDKKSLLIRSVPIELSRKMNSEAKLRGLTLGQFLALVLKQFFNGGKNE
jgi:hypothetical protein